MAIKRFLVVCFLLLASACSALAQAGGTGSIEGTVTDPSGAAVPGASVAATDNATHIVTARETTDAGFFVLPLLQPGEYTVTVKKDGFQTITQDHVIVDALAVVALNPKLQLGSATQSITVEIRPTMLMTDDVTLGSSMENNVYDSLPLAMNQSARDPSAFAGLAIGVEGYSTQPAGPSTGSFNGGQPYQNEGYIEGLPLTSAGTESDTRNLAFGISVEAIEQFQVDTTGSKAMYEGQGVSNYVVKSGTNKFHGGVYEYFRNTDFDAKGFFPKTTPIEHQNEFGVNIGGPIKKDKLFFFGNYDGYRFVSATPPGSQTIPTAAERMGDFSAFPQPIYDPLSTVCNAQGVCTRTQFSYNGVLNVIPPDRISNVAKSFQSYLPATSSGGIANNYLATLPNDVNNDSTTDKVDYNITDKHRLFVVYSHGKYSNPIVGSLVPITTSTLPIPYTDGRGVIEYATLIQIHETYGITPSVVNDFGYSISRLFIPLTSNTASGNYPSKAGLTGLPPGIASTGFPDITFTGNNAPVSWDGTNSHAFNEAQTSYSLQDNILLTKNKHNFTFGFQFQALQDNENIPLTGTQAGFTFSPNETANFLPNGSLDPTTGLSYASFLLGNVDSSIVTQNSVAETGGRYKTYAVYAQDDYKVTQRLTLNLGLRWDIWGPFTEVHNNLSFFNPTLANPLAGGIPGALQFAGNGTDSCDCSTPIQTHYKNFGPRVGLAYRIKEKTVVRAFYGMFYAHAGGVGGRVDGRQGLGQIGFDNNGNLASAITGQPAYVWDTGYPGNPLNPPFINPSYGIGFITKAAGASVGAGPTTAQALNYGDPTHGGLAPYYEDYSVNIQHSVTPNLTLSLAFSGSQGHRLPGATVANEFTNQIPLQYLPLGGLLTKTLTPATLAQAQAMFPNIQVPFPNFVGTIGQALRPFPQYAAIANPWLDVGNSTYNALQASLVRRLSKGLTFMANYTFSKELDDLANVRLPGDNALEKSPGVIDHAHVSTATFVYRLPFGHGTDWNPSNIFLSQLVSDWQLSGIFTFATGAPLTVTGTCNGGGIIDAVCYPNINPAFSGTVFLNGGIGSNGNNVSTTPYINKAAFVDPAAFTVGNAPRTAAYGLYAPSVADIDLSVRREFRVRESWRFSLQADAFNINNATYFAAPGLNIDSKSFGTYSAQANQPRKLQLSARFTF